MIAAQPPNQALRLEALRRYEILDTPKEPAYDDIVFLASQICGTPISVVNFIDEGRQWFKAEVGLGIRETPLDTSICSHAILGSDFLIIRDTLLDYRFSDNPLCLFDPKLRFYAGALLKTSDGLPIGTLCVLDNVPRDLTDLQRAALQSLARQVMSQLELRRSLKAARTNEELARSAMESSPDCVKLLDLEGRLLSMNQNGCRLLEIEDFSRIRDRAWIEFWPDAERGAVAGALGEALKGKNTQFTGRCPTGKGTNKWWEVTVSPVPDIEGKPSRILAVSRDITSRRAEEARAVELAKLESLGVLAGGIAHDFNNLLTSILGFGSLLQESSDEKTRAMANEIVQASERAADLTRQMLAYSGHGRFFVERLDLSALVAETAPLLETAMGNEVEIALSLDKHLPPVSVDAVQMKQLLVNLISNACEAMHGRPGRVLISTTALEIEPGFTAQTFRPEELSPGRYVQLEVRDTGVGMSEGTIAKVFDPFFTSKFAGRGLGLAAVSGILRGHRGGARIVSEVGHGTTFQAYLPVANIPAQSLQIEASAAALCGASGTILIVDDEDMVRRIGKLALEKTGYGVLLAADGKKGVELFEAHRHEIRLILLDLTMPVMNGEDAAAAIRSIDPDIPIIISSGYNQAEVVDRFAAHGIAGFIQKPFTTKKLAEKINSVLDPPLPR